MENINRLVKRSIHALLSQQHEFGKNPNWTVILGAVAAAINSQFGRGKNDVSAYEAFYGEKMNHQVTCTTAEACHCLTLTHLMKVMDEDDDFKAYVDANYYLADEEEYGDDDTILNEEDDGYFSDGTLPSEERDKVDDNYFFSSILVAPEDDAGFKDPFVNFDTTNANSEPDDGELLEVDGINPPNGDNSVINVATEVLQQIYLLQRGK